MPKGHLFLQQVLGNGQWSHHARTWSWQDSILLVGLSIFVWMGPFVGLKDYFAPGHACVSMHRGWKFSFKQRCITDFILLDSYGSRLGQDLLNLDGWVAFKGSGMVLFWTMKWGIELFCLILREVGSFKYCLDVFSALQIDPCQSRLF